MPWGSYVAPSKKRQANTLGYSPKALAEALGIHVNTVRAAYRAGELKVIRVSRQTVRIPFAEVERWLGRGGAKGSRARKLVLEDPE